MRNRKEVESAVEEIARDSTGVEYCFELVRTGKIFSKQDLVGELCTRMAVEGWTAVMMSPFTDAGIAVGVLFSRERVESAERV